MRVEQNIKRQCCRAGSRRQRIKDDAGVTRECLARFRVPRRSRWNKADDFIGQAQYGRIERSDQGVDCLSLAITRDARKIAEIITSHRVLEITATNQFADGLNLEAV